VPLGLRVQVELPATARLIAPGPAAGAADDGGGGPQPGSEPWGGAVGTVGKKKGGYRFLEERRLERRADGRPVLLLRREAALPLMRVAPAQYPAVADELRRVDALEQQEIRIGLEPERPGGGAR
jgi:hypothetical protein